MSGPRDVLVPPERMVRWRQNFEARHGGTATVTVLPDGVRLLAPDGAVAFARNPFPPGPPAGNDDPWAVLAEHVGRDRRVALLLARLGGHAVGVAQGGRLEASKVGSRQVHGRSAAGGWSQQRFARRREGQVRVALQACADEAARVLLPHLPGLEALVVGGERTAVDEVLTDPRLAGLAALRTPEFLTVADPRKVVLEAAVSQARSVPVRVTDP